MPIKVTSPSRPTRLRRFLQSIGRGPVLLLLPLLVVTLPYFKVHVDDVPVEVEGAPGRPSVCLDDVTGVDIPDEVYSCNKADWCASVGFDSMTQTFCPNID